MIMVLVMMVGLLGTGYRVGWVITLSTGNQAKSYMGTRSIHLFKAVGLIKTIAGIPGFEVSTQGCLYLRSVPKVAWVSPQICLGSRFVP